MLVYIYIQNFLNLYRTRFTKVDGEKLPEFSRDLKAHGDQRSNRKLNGNWKSQVEASNKDETKSCTLGTRVKRDIVRFSVT